MNTESKLTIEEWIERIIDGPGGFKVWEDREWVIFHTGRERGVAGFVIRCLANPLCEGSEEVLAAIMERRKKLNNEQNDKTSVATTDAQR